MILGLTGQNASGKGSVAEYLKEKGFFYFSLSDEIREEFARRGIKESRENLLNLANELREKFGSGILALRTLRKLEDNKNYVIDSIRNPAEVNVLESRKDFVLIDVVAKAEIRFERLKARGRLEDIKDLKYFKEVEERENSKEAGKQRVKDCEELAGIVLKNEGTLEELHKKIDKMLADLNKKFLRPGWDEYFIGIMKAVARRGTCDRGKVGCVIARDKQILVTGYAGSPKGLKHCDEIGHQIITTIHEDGSQTKHCVRTTHGEQNAICQAAKLGISINEATLYCSMTPCSACAKMIINAGIKRVVCEKRYHAGKETEDLFKEAGIKLDILNEEVEVYKNQK